jgi:hypothetical protein
MVNNSHLLKRGRQKLEPISIDELAGDSTMTGFSDLFKIPTVAPEEAASNFDTPSKTISETGGPVSAGVVSEVRGSGLTTTRQSKPKTSSNLHELRSTRANETGGSVSGLSVLSGGAPLSGSAEAVPSEARPSETGGPVSDPEGSIIPVPLQRKLQIREAKLVQEGHTYGEQTVYEALWKHGTVVNEQVRLITIGFLRMASIAGLAESNCKVATAGLLEKLTVERLPDKNISQGRTYRVYNWTSVLARRKAAGLTHVIKSRGVIFVDPKTGAPLTAAKTQPRRPKPVPFRETDEVETGGGPVSLPSVSISDSPTQTEVLATRLRQELNAAFDDRAASRLWRECQKAVPDCNVDEIMHFVLLKGQQLHRDRNIRNPIGLLLMSVPDFFNGNAVHELRATKKSEQEQQRTLQAQQRSYWKEVADNRSTPPDERDLALKFLAELE